MSGGGKSKKEHHRHAGHREICRLSLQEREQHYKVKAREAWDLAWKVLHSDTWKVETGTDLETGLIYSQHIHKLGKVFMLEGYVNATPEEVFEETVTKIEDSPKWNPTVLDCRTLQVVDDNTDISYNVTVDAVGGLVSSRDFVNLRHWETKDGIILSAGVSVMHPEMPPCKKYIRGENKSGGWVFKPAAGDQNRCLFCWIVNIDLKGWLPQYIVDQAVSGMLLQFLRYLQLHMEARRKS